MSCIFLSGLIFYTMCWIIVLVQVTCITNEGVKSDLLVVKSTNISHCGHREPYWAPWEVNRDFQAKSLCLLPYGFDSNPHLPLCQTPGSGEQGWAMASHRVTSPNEHMSMHHPFLCPICFLSWFLGCERAPFMTPAHGRILKRLHPRRGQSPSLCTSRAL